ncbi:MAG: type II toxin-antitoxin system death-on-curing family toxin [Candidatus Roizmanbacteria bacterium]
MTAIYFLSIEEVLIIHEKMIDIGGGSSGLRDIELLHSALGRSQASFGGEFLYNSIVEMGAAMLQSLVKNHPFIDGNKRTAFFSTLRFLEKNGYELKFQDDEIVKFMVEVDTKNLSIKEMSAFFTYHLVD